MKKSSISGRSAEYSPARQQVSRVLVNQIKQQDSNNNSVHQVNPFNSSGRVNNDDPEQQPSEGGRDEVFAANRQSRAAPPPPLRRESELDEPYGPLDVLDAGGGDVSLREVYLFDCCGLTRELKPAHDYLSPFRRLFHTFNTLVFLFGLANFGMGLWFRIDPKVYEIHKYIETQNFTIAGWIMLFGGFLACLMSLVGCLATIKCSITLLLWYLIIIIALTLAFVSTTIMQTIYGLGSTLELFLIKELYEQIRRRTMNTEMDLFASNEAVQFLDFVQVKMRCCGAADFRDYQKLGMVIPTTCYAIAGNYVNAPGCGRAIRRLMDIRAGMGTGFSAGSVFSQLAASLVCGLMICSIYSWRATPTPPSGPAQAPINRLVDPVDDSSPHEIRFARMGDAVDV